MSPGSPSPSKECLRAESTSSHRKYTRAITASKYLSRYLLPPHPLPKINSPKIILYTRTLLFSCPKLKKSRNCLLI
jgi:hypothetical protein